MKRKKKEKKQAKLNGETRIKTMTEIFLRNVIDMNVKIERNKYK